MKYLEKVRDVAAELMLLDENDELIMLDSITLVDFVTHLEQALKVAIPNSAIRGATFRNLESVAKMIEEVAEAA